MTPTHTYDGHPAEVVRIYEDGENPILLMVLIHGVRIHIETNEFDRLLRKIPKI